MKRLAIIFLFFVCSFSVIAQSKEWVKLMKKEAAFYFKNEDYYNALNFYNRIITADSKDEEAHILAVYSKFKLSYPLDSFLNHQTELINSKKADAKYCLAKIKHQQKEFDESIKILKECIKISSKKRAVGDSEINYMIAVNANAKQFTYNPHRSVIKNIGKAINTSYPEYVPVVSSDENSLYFTSRREGGINNKKDQFGFYHEDIYVSHKVNNVWQTAENIGKPVNTEDDDGCVAMTPDGYKMIVYRSTPDGINGNLYLTKLNDQNKWEVPTVLGLEVNSQYHESSACFTNDTSEMYFCSTRPGGYGGKDIYRIKRLPNGKWSAAYNLGPTINTVHDEESPYMHVDGSTFYFSSKGHNSMGEYDVYRCSFNHDTNQFFKAENLGYPINTVGNDVFFVLNVNGQKGYYSSYKEDSYGSTDIYEIDTRFGDNDLKVKSGFLFKDNVLGKGKITLLDNESNKVAGIYNSNPKTGKFILVVNPLKSYKAIIQEDGYQGVVLELEPIAFEKQETELEIKLLKK